MEMDEIKKRVLEDVDPSSRERVRRKRKRSALVTFLEFAAVVVVILLLFQFIWGIARVSGMSMYPTLHDRNLVLYDRVSSNYVSGDVVIIDRPGNETFVKRIVAVAGDTVNIEGGVLYVNGAEVDYNFTIGKTSSEGNSVAYPLLIQENEVFVLGDNRENSEDSRSFGPVSISDIKGRLLWYFGIVQ